MEAMPKHHLVYPICAISLNEDDIPHGLGIDISYPCDSSMIYILRFIVLERALNTICMHRSLKGKFSSGIEGALALTLHHDFNWKQLSEMMFCIVLLMFSKFICVTLIQKHQEYK